MKQPLFVRSDRAGVTGRFEARDDGGLHPLADRVVVS